MPRSTISTSKAPLPALRYHLQTKVSLTGYLAHGSEAQHYSVGPRSHFQASAALTPGPRLVFS